MDSGGKGRRRVQERNRKRAVESEAKENLEAHKALAQPLHCCGVQLAAVSAKRSNSHELAGAVVLGLLHVHARDIANVDQQILLQHFKLLLLHHWKGILPRVRARCRVQYETALHFHPRDREASLPPPAQINELI